MQRYKNDRNSQPDSRRGPLLKEYSFQKTTYFLNVDSPRDSSCVPVKTIQARDRSEDRLYPLRCQQNWFFASVARVVEALAQSTMGLVPGREEPRHNVPTIIQEKKSTQNHVSRRNDSVAAIIQVPGSGQDGSNAPIVLSLSALRLIMGNKKTCT